jgi:hypothetical protein
VQCGFLKSLLSSFCRVSEERLLASIMGRKGNHFYAMYSPWGHALLDLGLDWRCLVGPLL